MMTLTLAGYSISDVFDFTVTIILLINSALTPYLVIGFYPLYKRHIPSLWCLSHQDKRLDPLRKYLESQHAQDKMNE